jgi:hypothetical protein
MASAWLGLVLCAAAASEVRADPWYGCVRPPAPDACGPGTYCMNPCTGGVYGPCYWLRPPWPPEVLCPSRGGPGCPPGGQGAGPGGMMGGPGGPGGIAAFPTHPFARSPRDFFMED